MSGLAPNHARLRERAPSKPVCSRLWHTTPHHHNHHTHGLSRVTYGSIWTGEHVFSLESELRDPSVQT